ncbi:D-threo-aldose 1-dehydrogenase [Novosphingobium sp. THN1]|uniref:aldo/keto reductase n=1 Tax=Novosphingobium sp. THN1 TaxID=1016987 RepID=UPI000E49A811|nr:aldo/keto reductase [Novosphingobium sp. THN1]AXU19192.1 D-threo-aldose 1-dehydrogenase [Novosphingobium sp. THN1]
MIKKLGFGGAPLGNMFAPIDEATADATMQAAWHSGARHFDTAPVYGGTLGEHRFGRFLRQMPRDDFVISTKVGRLMCPGREKSAAPKIIHGPSSDEAGLFKGGLPFHAHVDYGYDAAMRSFEDSLQRLGLDRIDIVYVHDLGADHLGPEWEEHWPIAMNGAFRALRTLRDQGVIRAWGMGNNVIEPCLRALEQADPDIIHISGRYTLLDRSAEDLLAQCLRRGVPVVLGGCYNSGILADGPYDDYRPASAQRIAQRDRLAQVCARYGVSLKATALQFCARHLAVQAIVPGAKSPLKVRENALMLQDPIPPDLWTEIEKGVS